MNNLNNKTVKIKKLVRLINKTQPLIMHYLSKSSRHNHILNKDINISLNNIKIIPIMVKKANNTMEIRLGIMKLFQKVRLFLV